MINARRVQGELGHGFSLPSVSLCEISFHLPSERANAGATHIPRCSHQTPKFMADFSPSPFHEKRVRHATTPALWLDCITVGFPVIKDLNPNQKHSIIFWRKGWGAHAARVSKLAARRFSPLIPFGEPPNGTCQRHVLPKQRILNVLPASRGHFFEKQTVHSGNVGGKDDFQNYGMAMDAVDNCAGK